MMSKPFDPYLEWLGIKPRDQPPNHYRLLSIELFEDNPDIIHNAADQRTVYIRTFQLGKHSTLSQEILNEIAAAQVCLLDQETKSQYDSRLRSQLSDQPSVTSAAPVGAPTPVKHSTPPVPTLRTRTVAEGEVDVTSVPVVGRTKRKSRPNTKNRLVVHGVASVAGLMLGYLILCWISPRSDFLGLMGERQVAQGSSSEVVPREATPQPKLKVEKPDEVDPFLEGGTSSTKPSSSPIASKPPVEANPPTESAGDSDSTESDPSSPSAEPVPVEETKADRIKRLQREKEEALADGDVSGVLDIVGQIAQLNETDILAMQVDSLLEIHQAESFLTQDKAIAESYLKLLQQAIEAERADLAQKQIPHALAAARKSGDSELVRKTTISVLEAQKLGAP